MTQPKKPRGTRGGSEASTSTQDDAATVSPVPPLAPSTEVMQAAAARRGAKARLGTDETGFATGAVPQVSTLQAKWLALKASTGSDLAATQRLGLSLDTVMQWFDSPDFVAVHDELLENRREGFKSLATSTLPSVFTTLIEVLESGEKDADRVKAAAILLRNQGLLIDRAQTQDAGALAMLLADLRSPRPVIKTLPSGNNAAQEDSK